MKTKLVLSSLLVVLLLSAVAAFAAPKAEIWQDPDTGRRYLVDPVTREELSSSYDSIHIDVEGSGNFVGYYAGKKELLDPYTGEPIDRFYHEKYEKNGLRIGEHGSLKYILNSKTGKRMSSGYHEIYYQNGQLIGKRGTLKYILDSKTKRRASKGYHEIKLEITGFVGELGATREPVQYIK